MKKLVQPLLNLKASPECPSVLQLHKGQSVISPDKRLTGKHLSYKVVEIYTVYTELNEMLTFTLSLFNYLLLIPTIRVLGPFETFTKAKINFTLGAVILRLFVHPLAS